MDEPVIKNNQYWCESDGKMECPWCGVSDNDLHDIPVAHDGDSCDVECVNCDNMFHVVLRVKYGFTTSLLEKDCPHCWRKGIRCVWEGKFCQAYNCHMCDSSKYEPIDVSLIPETIAELQKDVKRNADKNNMVMVQLYRDNINELEELLKRWEQRVISHPCRKERDNDEAPIPMETEEQDGTP
jgi:hypothetical protein